MYFVNVQDALEAKPEHLMIYLYLWAAGQTCAPLVFVVTKNIVFAFYMILLLLAIGLCMLYGLYRSNGKERTWGWLALLLMGALCAVAAAGQQGGTAIVIFLHLLIATAGYICTHIDTGINGYILDTHIDNDRVCTGLAVGYLIIGLVCIPTTLYGFGSYERPPDNIEECQWQLTGLDIEQDLRTDLNDLVHGQPFVNDHISSLIASHLNDPDPPKPLFLALYGSTGIGKNLVSGIIADSVYQGGRKSEFVHTIIGPHHYPVENFTENYKEQLVSWVRGNVTVCSRSLFIIDEVDKMPEGVLTALKPYLGYTPVDGVDYRKTMFIMISNARCEDIDRYTNEHREKGGKREHISLEGLRDVIKGTGDPEVKDDLMVVSHLADEVIPFLPLEMEHIKLCIRDDLRRKNYNRVSLDTIEKVHRELTYWPEEEQVYSKTGCKRVSDKVDMVMGENTRRNQKSEL